MIDQRDVFLRSESVLLKSLTEDDALSSDWYSWFNDPDVTRWMQQHYFPNTRQLQVEFFRTNIQGSQEKLQLGIVPSNDQKLVGVISLSRIDLWNRSAEVSWTIGDPKYRNIEIAFESLKLIIDHAFYRMNLRRLHGGAVDKAVKDFLCRLLNFSHEGTARQAVYLNGQYLDVYQMGLLEPEYKHRRSTEAESE